MRHPLSEQYRSGREQLLRIGRSLAESEGLIRTTACPEWTIKDVFAHLAGVSTEILSGNTADAGTPAWADGHVADRRDRRLEEVLDEWTTAGAEVSNLVESSGEVFPRQLFIDQWTHEWDIRAAIEGQAAAVPDMAVFRHYFDDLAAAMTAKARGRELDRLSVEVDGRRFVVGAEDRPDVGELSLTVFEFARISMGRRSKRQLRELEWPMEDIDGHVDVLVLWTVNALDVPDPVIQVD